MTIFEFADVINAELIVRRCPASIRNETPWLANFGYCEIKDGACLSSSCGYGNSPEQAIREYEKKIQGQELVFYAMNDKNRKIYFAPANFSAP